MPHASGERQPWRDPIVADVRRAREALLAAAGYDIRELCRRMREKQATSSHRVVVRDPSARPGETT